jgi:uncharacterized glyoxalase superfamily protein PhnB
MIKNRSAPPGPVVPVLIYNDVPRAIEWLCGAFGFRERLHTPPESDGTIHHAQLAVGEGAIMLRGRSAVERNQGPAMGSAAFFHGFLVKVEDADAHCEHARRYGASILRPPRTCEFGERQYTARDLAGNEWTFSQTIADVAPETWGAQVKEL